ncbi:pyridoxal phosphate-dependent aminotransferase family protein [Flavimarina sp. Hel_I_48]|uniref:pyridoxal phosphate-dependent aminotransferase family protein n=1 Tax=Flavimarina sp. Hel_I_48 TaxID=1392488 RepID=UPI0004DF7AC5|nr:pyridoxal phosphate-dependent aminotransferase family protein [Flavimarina sp. Hel_I_48]
MAIYLKKVPARTITENGREYLYFGGTSYLGLQHHPEFEDLLIKNIKEYGVSHGASRKSNIRLKIYDEAETFMANWTGAEASLIVSSGYLAGQLLRDYFDEDGYAVFYMPHTHTALSRKRDLFYGSNADLEHALEKHLNENPSQTPVLFLDTVTFSNENFPDFEFLKTLPLDRIILVADDSHGIGIIGEYGSGAFSKLSLLGARELLVCGSLSKGPTIQAGFILGEINRIDHLKNSLPFGGSSPASPASIATLLEADSIYTQQRKKLAENVNFFLDLVNNKSFFQYTAGHPAFAFRSIQLAEYLRENSVLVTHFNYPNSDAVVLSRIVLSAGHTPEDIANLCGLINEFLAKNA